MKSIKKYVNENLQNINEAKSKYDYKFKVKGMSSTYDILNVFPVYINDVEYKVVTVDAKNGKILLCDVSGGNILHSDAKNTKKFVDDYFKDSVNKITLKAFHLGSEKLNSYYDIFVSAKTKDSKTITLQNGNEVLVVDEFKYKNIPIIIFKQGGYNTASGLNFGILGIKGDNKTKLKKTVIEFLDKKVADIGFDKLKEILSKK